MSKIAPGTRCDDDVYLALIHAASVIATDPRSGQGVPQPGPRIGDQDHVGISLLVVTDPDEHIIRWKHNREDAAC